MAAADSAVLPALAAAEHRDVELTIVAAERMYVSTGPQRFASPPPGVPAKVIALVLVFQLGALVALSYLARAEQQGSHATPTRTTAASR